MLRNPLSTIYRNLDLPSTQWIQTHNTSRPPRPWPKSTNHSPPPNTSHSAPSQKHIHLSHTPPTPLTTLISSTSPALAKHLNHVSPPYTHSPQPHLPRTPHQHCCHPLTLTVSQHTHMQHKQCIHHSHRNNIRYHDNLTDRPRTTTGTQTPHKHTDPAVKVREISSYCKST